MICVSDFETIRPPYESPQKSTLDWLSKAHAQAEAVLAGKSNDDPEIETFQKFMHTKLSRFGCKPEQIHKRGHILPDYLHSEWKAMKLYQLDACPNGLPLENRIKLFDLHVTEIFEQFFPPEYSAPEDLIHVTCTGYVAPSGAQKIVSLRNWNEKTTVTHAYHMGCHGAISALRIAQGFSSFGKSHIDIVHTELCSLHANPSLHGIDQLISQTLFADGFIKYSIKNKNGYSSYFKVHAILENLIPNSVEAMSWNPSSWGFLMSLSKEIPALIASALPKYLQKLCAKANFSYEELRSLALFAIHPGGPKIVSNIQELLQLKEEQIRDTLTILQTCGNMSSATLPHIWKLILENESIYPGTFVISCAFGPGLTICGALLEKCGD